MLSNQTCTNPTGLHRRQQSTPTLLTLNQPLALPRIIQYHEQQRRSLSQDRALSTRIKEHDVKDITLHIESAEGQQDGQQNLQETQQPYARPGQEDLQIQNENQEAFRDRKPLQSRLPSYGCISANDIDALLQDLQSGRDTATTRCNDTAMEVIHPSGSLTCNIQDAYKGNLDMTTNGLIVPCQENLQQRLVMPISRASEHTHGRPRTPEHQMIPAQNVKAPSTAPTAFSRRPRSFSRNRMSQSSSSRTDLSLTIGASQPMQRGRSYEESFATMRPFDVGSEPLSPPKTAPIARRSVDFAVMPSPGFLDMSDLRADMPTGRGYNPTIYSPLANPIDSTISSFQSSPEPSNVSLFESTEVDDIVLDAQLSFMQAARGSLDLSGQSSPIQRSQHQRAQSMTDADLEDCIRDTGVTAEEIASFIQGPLPEDQKWSCLYEEVRGKPCGKRFARKENAKSHVQTHLGDRQYVCKVCKTPFVRQHDLKRHFKIHTTEKPHRCPCGKDFHRHDALTRHRQRGMCSGAFDGALKKIIKRGRPKKPRPSNEERTEKAARTRQYIMEKTKPGSTYASSISGSSESSAASPPSFDNASITASSPSLTHIGLEEFTVPNPPSQPLTPPTSPERSLQTLYPSPFLRRSYSPKRASESPSPKLTSIAENDQVSAEQAYGSNSQYQNSPPELDLSSSSPATSNILDFSTFSELRGSQGQRSQKMEYCNPQILSSDFQLFDNSSKDDEGAIKFEDFLDFDNVLETDRQKQRVRSGSSLNQQSFDDAIMNSLDDPFMDL